MNTTQLDAAIRTQIDQFLTTISALVRQSAVEAVKEALGAGAGLNAAPAKRGRGRPRKAEPNPVAKTPAGKRGRRSSADVEKISALVRDYVSAHPGQRLEEIGRGLGTDTAGLKRPIQALLASKALRTEGRKRGTKYFPAGKAVAGAARQASKPVRRKGGKRSTRAGVKKAGRKARTGPKAKVKSLAAAA